MKKYLSILIIFLLVSCNKDIKNGRVFGYVRDSKTQKPLSGITLFLDAEYYEGGDYDSYNGHIKRTVITDSEGYFEANFDKIAFVAIKARKPSGQIVVVASEIFTKNKEMSIGF